MFLLFLLLPSLDLVHPLCGCFPFWMDTVVALLSCRTTVFLSCHGWILTNFGFQVFHSERAKLFLLRDGSWVKQEWGIAQLLLHDVSGKMCFFMRSDVSQRALCSSLVVPDTWLVQKGDRSVHWKLHDHSTGSLRSLRVALLFQDELRRSQFVNAFYEAAGINEY